MIAKRAFLKIFDLGVRVFLSEKSSTNRVNRTS
jgi:hypothetical protein